MGKPADLAALGLSTGLYFSGTLPEDMAILVSGAGSGSTPIIAKSSEVIDPSSMPRVMEGAFSVSFLDDGTYMITDVGSGSIVANRNYDPIVGVQYGEITVRFDSEPVAGDEFLIEPTEVSSGSNGTIVALASLQQEKVFPFFQCKQP